MFFHALIFAWSPGGCLNTRPINRSSNMASVISMKQTCVIVILADFMLFQSNLHINASKTLNYPFSYSEFL